MTQMPSRHHSRARRPARGVTAREVRRRLLIVCEGAVTERDYIRGVERHLRNAAVQIEIPKVHGDPRHVVERAKALKEDDDAESTRLDDRRSFDEVWCVFDRDDHERFLDACKMACDNHLEVAASNPCFELWLLLHFRDSPGMQSRHTVKSMLRRFIPGFAKALDEFEGLELGLDEARNRARRLDQEAERLGERYPNPTTGVYLLVESMMRTDDP
jgi:hypothetical protein